MMANTNPVFYPQTQPSGTGTQRRPRKSCSLQSFRPHGPGAQSTRAATSCHATIRLTTRRAPGGQGSWVQCPHGPATVSGERASFCSAVTLLHQGAVDVTVASAMGRRRARATIRKSGYLPPWNPSFGHVAMSATGTGAGHAGEAICTHLSACTYRRPWSYSLSSHSARRSARRRRTAGAPSAGKSPIRSSAPSPAPRSSSRARRPRRSPLLQTRVERFEVATGVPGRFTVRASAPGLASGSHVVDVGRAGDRGRGPGAAGGGNRRTTGGHRHAGRSAAVARARQHHRDHRRNPGRAPAVLRWTGAARRCRGSRSSRAAVRARSRRSSRAAASRTSRWCSSMASAPTPSAAGSISRRCRWRTWSAIEVVRGPQSALYGADAIGGVVQIITRSGGPPAAQGLFEGGSRGMWRGAASTTGEARGFRWQLGGDRFEEDGFTGEAANGETVSNDDARTSQAAVTLGWRHVGSGADLQGTARYVDTDRGTPGPYGSDPAGRFGGVDRTSRNLTTRARRRHALAPALVRRLQPGASAHRGGLRRLRPHQPKQLPVRGRVAADARAHPDRRRRIGGAGLHRRHRVAGRAGLQHLHHRG